MATLEIRSYGAKAHFLSRLRAMQVNVPEFVALPLTSPLPNVERLRMLLERTLPAASADGVHYRLAIRSSAADEDLSTGSKAGSYLTHIGEFTAEETFEAVAEVRASDPDGRSVGVVLQRFVEPAASGVVFSLDPISYARDSWTVAWVEGRGDALVSGAVPGESAVLRHPIEVPAGWPAGEDDFARVLRTASLVEAGFGFPVDIEWVVDDLGVWFVQARPVVLPPAASIPLVSGEFERLPAAVRQHSKIALREAAASKGVPMSRAVIELWPGTVQAVTPAADLGCSGALSEMQGVSVVLLHPSHINDKVVREFAPVATTDVEFWTRECRRYSIRRYPGFSDVGTTAAKVLARGLEESWVSAAIVQEIYDAHATGIVRRSEEDGFVVELARGHFVPKGFVTTSRFLLDSKFRVFDSQRLEQDAIYHFINGHVVTESPAEVQLALTDDEVGAAVEQLAPMFDAYPDAALEFGIVSSDGEIVAYLIDAAEADVAGIETSSSLLTSGVISGGISTGRVLRVPQDGGSAEGQHLDAHLAEVFSSSDPITDTVLVADRASVDLLPLVYRAGANCAFVFRSASLLAHLAVVLRERGVPAVVIGSDRHLALRDGDEVTVDGASIGLGPNDRVKRMFTS